MTNLPSCPHAAHNARIAELEGEIARLHAELHIAMGDLIASDRARLSVIIERDLARADAEMRKAAIERYLALDGQCDFVDGEPAACPGVVEYGHPCHWCELRAAVQDGAGAPLLALCDAVRAVVDQARRGFGTEADIERAHAFDPVALVAAIRRYDAALEAVER